MMKPNQVSALKQAYSNLEDMNEQIHNDVPIDNNDLILETLDLLAVAFQKTIIDGEHE